MVGHAGAQEPGQRHVLRRPRASDVDALVRLRSDSAARQFLGGPISGDAALKKANDLVSSDVHFVVEAASGNVAGVVSVTPREGDMELSYEFFPDYWGQGLARAACDELLERVIVPEHSRLVAVTQRSNERSRRLLDSLGFDVQEEFEEFGTVQVLYVRSG